MGLPRLFLLQLFAAIGHGDAERRGVEGVAVAERGDQVGHLAIERGHRRAFLAFGGQFLKDADADGDAADEGYQAQRDVGDGRSASM